MKYTETIYEGANTARKIAEQFKRLGCGKFTAKSYEVPVFGPHGHVGQRLVFYTKKDTIGVTFPGSRTHKRLQKEGQEVLFVGNRTLIKANNATV